MAVIQRPLKGSRISSFYPVKSLPLLTSLDSAFQLQEYISLLIRLDVHDVDAIVSLPGRQNSVEREGSEGTGGEERDAEKHEKLDVAVDESCWVYEQLRRLAQDLTHPLITTLQQECTRATCPEMKAGEWLYLCVAHGNDGAMEQCCAIDYILHTLDSATALLNSPRAFPSRLSIPPTSTRHFSSLARRLGRIFAHAYYHHREAFEQAEAESSLYGRFLALTSKFNLVPSEFIMIPPRIGNLEEELEREEQNGRNVRRVAEAEPQQQEPRPQWNLGGSSSVMNLTIGRSSPPEIARSASPRRVGRSRTDTMVYSEAATVAEELAKSENYSEAELDRAIAVERMLAAVEHPLLEPLAAALETGPAEVNPEPEPAHDTSQQAEVPTVPVPEEDEALPAEAEVVLNIVAPEPAEPAIPTDVEEEDDIADTDEAATEHVEVGVAASEVEPDVAHPEPTEKEEDPAVEERPMSPVVPQEVEPAQAEAEVAAVAEEELLAEEPATTEAGPPAQHAAPEIVLPEEDNEETADAPADIGDPTAETEPVPEENLATEEPAAEETS